jgi:predicted RND superfamily exporter protein
MLAVSNRYGTILTPDNLQIIRDITKTIENTEHVDRVISLTNAEYIKNSEWGMEVLDLYPEGMAEDQAVAEMKRRLVDWKDVYNKILVTGDLRMSAIMVKVAAHDESSDTLATVYRSLQLIMEDYQDLGLNFFFTGEPVIEEEMSSGIVGDLFFLIPLSALIICMVMYLTFHRLEGVVYPMLSLIAATVLTMGVMAITGVTFTMASMLIPILMLVVGSAYCIHIMAHFYDIIAGENGFIGPEKIRSILSTVIADIRISVLMAGFTTVAGFISLVTSPLDPLKSFALLTALGVAFALLFAFILIPVLIRIRYRKGAQADHFKLRQGFKGMQKSAQADSPIFRGMARIVRKGKVPVLLITGLLLVVTIFQVINIETGMSFINFFAKSTAVRQNTDQFNQRMSGTGNVTVRFDALEKGDILDPLFLSKVEQFSDYMAAEYKTITTISSLVPQIKRINKIMNYDSIPYPEPVEVGDDFDSFFDDVLRDEVSPAEDALFSSPAAITDNAQSIDSIAAADTGLTYAQTAAYLETALLSSGIEPAAETVVREFLAAGNYQGEAFNEIPLDPAKYGLGSQRELHNLLSQYMVLYSGSIDSIVNDAIEPDKMLMTMVLNDESSGVISDILEDTDAYWSRYIPDGWTYHIAGNTTLLNSLNTLITRSQIVSIITALFIIFVVLLIIYRSFVMGLIGLIPVLAGLIGIFLTMGLAGFNLDFITALLGSLAVGIGVDYAIHFLSAYRRSVQRGETDPLAYVYRTTGRAIFFNAASVAVGFLALLLSNFIPLRQVGLLFGLAMAFAGVSSLILVPIALHFYDPRFLRRETPGDIEDHTSLKENKTMEVLHT